MKPDLNIIPEPNPYNTPANIAAKRRSLLSIFRVWLIFAVNSTKTGNSKLPRIDPFVFSTPRNL